MGGCKGGNTYHIQSSKTRPPNGCQSYLIYNPTSSCSRHSSSLSVILTVATDKSSTSCILRLVLSRRYTMGLNPTMTNTTDTATIVMAKISAWSHEGCFFPLTSVWTVSTEKWSIFTV